MTQNTPLLIAAIITITLALVFYTTGVWSEKMQGQLKKWHLLLFWTGIIFDTTGTKELPQTQSLCLDHLADSVSVGNGYRDDAIKSAPASDAGFILLP